MYPPAHFQPRPEYALLPFRFARLRNTEYLLTNLVGEYAIVHRDHLDALVHKRLATDSPTYTELKAKHFLIDDTSSVALDLLAAKYRTKLAGLAQFVQLHIFVTTLRCNNQCTYCQVSSQSPDRERYDMTPTVADAAIQFMCRCPAGVLKVEFQGGEPLLNFPLIEYAVKRTKELNTGGRRIEFVVCTNLTLLTDPMMEFFEAHDILISTSLDGPEDLHNKNRPGPHGNTYQAMTRNVRRLQERIGPHRVAALMTTTRETLDQPERVIDEYVRRGFRSIFLRSINPYGRATNNNQAEYPTAKWNEFYRRALAYIIALNQQGVAFREEYSSMILRKILTPYGTGFVDLQNPTGTGTGVLVYDYNGNVYPSDEARMLAAMGDEEFLLGNLLRDTLEAIITSDKLVGLVRDTMLEGVPQCAECAFLPYCGADPVKHYRTQGDTVGHKPTSGFCQKNTFIFRHLIDLLENDQAARRVLTSWV